MAVLRQWLDPLSSTDQARFRIAIVRIINITDRTGNWMFEHVFWRLMAMAHHTPYLDPFQWFKCPSGVFDCGAALDWNTNYETVRDFDAARVDHRVPHYPFHFSLYEPHKEAIETYMLRPRHCRDTWDLAIYMRLDDVAHSDTYNYHWYTPVPMHFYARVLDRLAANHSAPMARIIIVGHPLTKLQHASMRRVAALVNATFRVTPVVHTDRSVDDDMQAIMNARVLIAAPGSFWFWPSFLSCVQHTVHVPRHGLLAEAGLTHPNRSIVCDGSQRWCVVSHHV